MDYKEVTETIIGCAYRVYSKMGFGFLETVYQKCLVSMGLEYHVYPVILSKIGEPLRKKEQ